MQNDPFYQENSNAYTSRERDLIAIIIVLLIALAGMSYWAFFKKQENTTITKENIAYESENKELISLRDSLFSQVESLSSNFAALSEENQSLQGSLNDAKNELTSKLKTLSLYKKIVQKRQIVSERKFFSCWLLKRNWKNLFQLCKKKMIT